MIEHPIPQNVASYQFHLVGDMTMKQFLELAGGVVGAWVIWSLHLPGILRWPLAIIAAFGGVALAFFPFEERPLDQWVIAFFRAVYRPTIFIWKRTERTDFFELSPKKTNHDSPIEAISKAPTASFQTLLEAYELQEREQTAPDPLMADRLAHQARIADLLNSISTLPPAAAMFAPKKLAPPLAGRPISSRMAIHPLAPPGDPSAILRGEITLNLKTPAPSGSSLDAAAEKTPKNSVQINENQTLAAPGTLPTATVSAAPPAAAPPAGGGAAAANPHLPMPGLPDYPNILSGMVLTPQGELLANAIIEIRDSTGLPIRAVKTNKLGQFTIATPLPDGSYKLLIEADGANFDALDVAAAGKIIPPIEIRARA